MSGAFSIEKNQDDGTFCGIVWSYEDGYFAITDIAETDTLADLAVWLGSEYPNVTHVKIGSSVDAPDVLSVFEAAEAAYAA